MSNTITLHRVLKTTPAKVYRAFTEPHAFARWVAPCGFTCTIDAMDAKVGGRYHMAFTNFTTGQSHGFGGEFLELVPGERLVYTDVFDDPNLPGEMKTTVTIRQVAVGTEIHIVQEGVPDVIPPEACYLGWQESLNFLAMLVEPDIQQ